MNEYYYFIYFSGGVGQGQGGVANADLGFSSPRTGKHKDQQGPHHQPTVPATVHYRNVTFRPPPRLPESESTVNRIPADSVYVKASEVLTRLVFRRHHFTWSKSKCESTEGARASFSNWITVLVLVNYER